MDIWEVLVKRNNKDLNDDITVFPLKSLVVLFKKK